MKRLAVLAMVVVVLAPLRAQVVQEMTPALIAEAIRAGQQGKIKGLYPMQHVKTVVNGIVVVPRGHAYFTTPFQRVAEAAYEAKSKNQPFSAANLTPEMVRPEVEVFVRWSFSDYAVNDTKYPFTERIAVSVVNPKEVALFRDPHSEAAVPIRGSSNKIRVNYRPNKAEWAMQVDGTQLIGVYPLDVLGPDTEVRVLFADFLVSGNLQVSGAESTFKFKLDKIR